MRHHQQIQDLMYRVRNKIPYELGGNSWDATDCSGLVHLVFKEVFGEELIGTRRNAAGYLNAWCLTHGNVNWADGSPVTSDARTRDKSNLLAVTDYPPVEGEPMYRFVDFNQESSAGRIASRFLGDIKLTWFVRSGFRETLSNTANVPHVMFSFGNADRLDLRDSRATFHSSSLSGGTSFGVSLRDYINYAKTWDPIEWDTPIEEWVVYSAPVDMDFVIAGVSDALKPASRFIPWIAKWFVALAPELNWGVWDFERFRNFWDWLRGNNNPIQDFLTDSLFPEIWEAISRMQLDMHGMLTNMGEYGTIDPELIPEKPEFSTEFKLWFPWDYYYRDRYEPIYEGDVRTLVNGIFEEIFPTPCTEHLF